ncbi:hypothetical protein LJR234_003620 [Mesorhizobium amorphae]|uniref:hypothetical protein n=1 Tax=Mesorhizobium amorphae TaxID=71433 RepID=UPI003ECFAE2C
MASRIWAFGSIDRWNPSRGSGKTDAARVAIGSSMVDASSAAARILLNREKERRATLAFAMNAKNLGRPADTRAAGSAPILIETISTTRVPPSRVSPSRL